MGEPDKAITSVAGSDRSLLALALTLLVPGLGHGVRGAPRRGAIWLAGLAGLWLLVCVIGAWWLGAFVIGMALSVLWYAGIAYDAYRLPKHSIQMRRLLELVGAAVVVLMIGPVVLPLLIRTFSVEAYKVAGASMCPTFAVGDHLFIDKTAYRGAAPSRGDIIVYRSTQAGGAEIDFLHRVVAVAGDELEVQDDGALVINGERVPQKKTEDLQCNGVVFEEQLGNTHRIVDDPVVAGRTARLRVPDGHVFVLGDNRDNAADSRQFGTLSVDDIRGRAWRIWQHADKLTWRPID